MSNGAIDAAARRATLPTKFATGRAAQQNAQAPQKKWTISNPAPAAGNSGRQSPSPLKGHAVSPVVNSATNTAPIYARMQAVVQRMLHSEDGVPIRSHKRRLISAIPSAFTGADVVTWLMKNLSIQSKAEAIHLATMLSKHGFFFCVEGLETPMRDDGTLFRFQTPYYWPSQNPVDNDVEYGVYLVKQVLRSKHRIRLLDYELNNLHKLKLRLAKEWKNITEKADMDVKIFREQKRVAKAIISSQEEAFWRLRRPPPGETSMCDATLTRLCTKRPEEYMAEECTLKALRGEMLFLQRTSKKTRVRLSTSLESAVNFCQRYHEFDPMLTSPLPSNPWVSNDNTLWTIEKSLLENPTERQAKKWACSFQDLLTDVTGRFKFEKFCKNQFCLENVRFWQACRDLKFIPLMAVEGSVKLIYDEFLQRGSSSEVNVSANVQDEIERDTKDPSRYAFTAAQEQIYQLMQKDIYPRFLNSQEYRMMLKKGKEVQPGGKGFFSKLQYGLRKSRLEANLKDATGISPNLPQRYARRQLSISRRMSGPSSGSLDDIFLSTSASTPNFLADPKRRSAYTEAFIDTITAPVPEKCEVPDQQRVRRVSAPINPPYRKSGSSGNSSLDQVFEEGGGGGGGDKGGLLSPVSVDSTIPMSYSADDLKQLQEDADSLGPSKWKKYGIAASFIADALSSPHDSGAPDHQSHLLGAPCNGSIHPSRSMSHDLKDQAHEILQVPTFELVRSPKCGAYEFESFSPTSPGVKGLLSVGSRESLHSTSSQ